MLDYDIRHGRTYLYLKSELLYPFGYGLSLYGLFLFQPPHEKQSLLCRRFNPGEVRSQEHAVAPARRWCSYTSNT